MDDDFVNDLQNQIFEDAKATYGNTALRVAIAGNVIDFGANWDFDLEAEIGQILENDFAIGDFHAFKDSLDAAGEILYIGDNAGECVFDRILIEEIKKPVVYVVREAPNY